MAYADKDPEYIKGRRDIDKLQTSQVHLLLESANVIIPEEDCGIPELQQFQQHLKNYKRVVILYLKAIFKVLRTLICSTTRDIIM